MPDDIGMCGGFYCPPTVEHFNLAQAVSRECGLSVVYMVVAADPNHRVKIVDASVRFDLVVKAASAYPGVIPSDIEIRRGGTTYTVDTVRALKVLHPHARINVVVGAEYVDPAAKWFLLNWERSSELVQECRFITHPRGGVADLAQTQTWAALAANQGVDIFVADYPSSTLSATIVREKSARGESVRGLVPDSILDDVQRIFGPQQQSS
ncbi:MAG: nicotinate-nicotinamide nucleotide adenylyltransferase [Terriglobales bacterium]